MVSRVYPYTDDTNKRIFPGLHCLEPLLPGMLPCFRTLFSPHLSSKLKQYPCLAISTEHIIIFEQMLLYIKNMVCNRCKSAVRIELEKLGLHPVSVALGEVAIEEKELSASQVKVLSSALSASGFELIDDKRSKLIENVKNIVISSIHHAAEKPSRNYSELIAQQLHHDYSYISKLFSEVEGMTIEQYIISQRIEKAKELLLYNELSLTEVAYQLGYSSPAHLSAQFKKITGLTPSAFKSQGFSARKELDRIGKPE
jgi:AraC family transcriptional regulator